MNFLKGLSSCYMNGGRTLCRRQPLISYATVNSSGEMKFVKTTFDTLSLQPSWKAPLRVETRDGSFKLNKIWISWAEFEEAFVLFWEHFQHLFSMQEDFINSIKLKAKVHSQAIICLHNRSTPKIRLYATGNIMSDGALLWVNIYSITFFFFQRLPNNFQSLNMHERRVVAQRKRVDARRQSQLSITQKKKALNIQQESFGKKRAKK